MVVFVDLDAGDEPPQLNERPLIGDWQRYHGGYMTSSHDQVLSPSAASAGAEERVNPNLTCTTEALGCYPIITSIASHLDLNSLDNLSRTCRQARSNLLQFRRQLITQTLHCCNESVAPDVQNTLRFRARAADWYFVEPDGGRAVGVGKVGDCARDLVGDCRRCGSVVCRNCTIKPPAPVLLRKRHRRLCPTCVKAPIISFLGQSSTDLPRSTSPTTPTSYVPPQTQKCHVLPKPATTILQDAPYCKCPQSTYLCQPCGRGMRSADTTYDSIWRWRTRYNASGSGGMGTGISDGNRSFECGRSSNCLKAKWVEEEIDCDAEDAREIFTSLAREESNQNQNQNGVLLGSSVGSNNTSGSYGSTNGMAPGYMRHEIEGIGGVVKKKMLRMVKVGACVTEWEDEKERGMYLVREADGKCRSWCGWCWRVVLGEKDYEALGLENEASKR